MKRKIIMLLESTNLLEIYSLNLSAYAEAEVIHCLDLNPILKKLKEKENIDMIVASKNALSHKQMKELSLTIQNESPSTCLLFIGDEDRLLKTEFFNVTLDFCLEADDIKEFISSACRLLKISDKDLRSLPTSKYFAIPLHHFKTLTESYSDVYIKIGQGEQAKYIKRINIGEGIDEAAIIRYQNFKADKLYIESIHRLAFVNALTERLCLQIDDPDTDPASLLQAEVVAHETLQLNPDNLCDPEMMAIASVSMQRAILDALEFTKVNGLIQSMLQNTNSYAFKHYKLSVYFSITILKSTDWGKKGQEESLAFIALFSDILLKNDDFVKISGSRELKEAKLNNADRELVENHAKMSTALIAHYPRAPLGSDISITHHHGNLQGYGFAEFYPGNLSPISIIFIVAQECAHYVLKNNLETIDKPATLIHLMTKFPTNRFRKLIESLATVL